VLVNHAMSRGQYDTLSATLPRAYVEINGTDHFAFTAPSGSGGLMGTYTWGWLNAYVNGVSECKSLFVRTPALSDFASGAL
jgi:hypothetical protein